MMPVILRRIHHQKFMNHTEIAGDSWDLRTQIEALEEWMITHGRTLDTQYEWVADVGFTTRTDATGGGPPITKRLMSECIKANLEIYLSEYGSHRPTSTLKTDFSS